MNTGEVPRAVRRRSGRILARQRRRGSTAWWRLRSPSGARTLWPPQVALSKGCNGNEVYARLHPAGCTLRLLVPPGFQSDMGGHGASGNSVAPLEVQAGTSPVWSARCGRISGDCRSCSRRSISRCRRRVRRWQDGSGWRQLDLPWETTRDTVRLRRLAHHGVPALWPKDEHAFLEYVEKAYRETQGGDRAAGPHLREVVYRRAAERADWAASARRKPRLRAGGALRFWRRQVPRTAGNFR